MNIIEEYLVKIGATIDREAFNGAAQAINQLAAMAEKLGRAFKYGALLAAIAKVTEAIVQNIKAVADADMEYQKLAKTLWVTKETAKAFSLITKTMGAKPEDIAWIPELREQFFRLRAEMNALATPSDADGQLRWIRDIGYDVQSLQLKLKMLREWVVYYLIKYLGPYIKEVQKFIRWISDALGKNMPAIAQRLARVLSSVVSIGVSALRLFKNVYEAITRFVGALPERTKKMVAVFALAGAAIMAGPFGLFMVALGGALLLLEDFYYYLDGKKSSRSLAPLWAWLTKSDNPLRKLLGSIESGLGTILDLLGELFDKVMTEERQKQLKETVQAIANGVADIAKGLSDIIDNMLTKKTSSVNYFWRAFTNGVSDAVKKVLLLGEAAGNLFSAIGKALSGDYKGAAESLRSSWGNLKQVMDIKGLYEAFTPPKTGDKEKDAYNYFLSQGLSPAAAAGFVGNFMQESGLDENAIGDNGTSGGIAQWHNERWQALKYFAAGKGLNWNDFSTQLQFVMEELRTTQSETYRRLLNAKTPEEAAQIISDFFERPAKEYANNAQRRANARGVYDANTAGTSNYKFNLDDKPGPKNPWDFDLGLPSWPPKAQGMSYAEALASGASFMPMGGNSTDARVINVGGIVVNCGNSTNPREIAAAVGDEVVDRAKRMAAWNGGGVLV